MMSDYLDPRNAEGMPKLVDNMMSLTLMLNAKNAVRSYAIALSESATPEVRDLITAQLNSAVERHEEITKLMIQKGWFHPVNLEKQFQMDLESSTTASQIANLDLFPGDTSRRGMFSNLEM